MSIKEKALYYISQANYAELFELLDDNIKDKTLNIKDKALYAELKNEFIAGKTGANYPDRLAVLVNDLFPDSQENTKFLSNFTPIYQIIGREKELKDLHQSLQKGKATVVLNGLGGMGKTTLAKYYVTHYQRHYTHILWLEQQNKLLNAFINEPKLLKNFKFTNQDEAERFTLIKAYLKERKGQNLLIIDNFADNQSKDNYKILQDFKDADFQHWTILCTSREQIPHLDKLNLSKLSPDEAIKLFQKHCPDKAIDLDQLQNLLKLIAYHTLTTELLAKTYTENIFLDNIQAIIDILEKKDLNHEELQIPIDIGENAEEKELYTHLLQIFTTQKLSKEECYILKQFVVLPNQAIEGKQLLGWLKDDKRQYTKALNTLTKKGWLQSQDSQTFEMHRLVQILLYKTLSPTYEDNQALLESILKELNYDKIKATPLALQYLTNYAESLLRHLDFQEKKETKGKLENKLAKLYENLGLYTQAEDFFLAFKATEAYRVGKEHQDYATSLNNLAGLYQNQGKYMEAKILYLEVIKILKEVLGKNHPNYASSLSNLASLYDNQSKYKEAKFLYIEALQIKEKVLGKNHPDYATSLNNLASLYQNQGKYDKAEPLYIEASEIWEKVLGKNHPHYAMSLNNLAGLYDNQGKYKEAKFLYIKAIQIKEKVLGKNHPDYVNSLHNLATSYYNQRKYDKAEPLYIKAIQIKEKVLGKNHPDYATSLNNLASLYQNQGKYDKAEPLYIEASEIWEKVLGKNHPDYATSLNNLAVLYYYQKKYKQAENYMTQAYTIRLEVLGEKHPYTQESKESLKGIREAIKQKGKE